MSKAAVRAFTVVELLVAIAIIAILVAILLPVLSRAQASGQRAACLNNLKQIAAGVHLYGGDFNEILFPITNTYPNFSFSEWTAYDPLMRSYAGLKGAPSPQDKLFACPADTFYYYGTNNSSSVLVPQSRHLQSNTRFSSYAFNAANAAFRITNSPFPGMLPGIMGSKLSSIEHPARTVLVGEFPAWDGYSWHRPLFSAKHYNNAPDVLSFADGHVSYTKMYCGSNNPSHLFKLPLSFDPPAEYDYQWSGN